MHIKCPHCQARIPIVVPNTPWTLLKFEGECPNCGQVVSVSVTVGDVKRVGPSETK